MTENSPASVAPVSDAGQLAIDRTRLAYERTLLAWIRTCTGLITFGFSIYKFFEFQDESHSVTTRHHLVGPREFAILTIGLGLTGLLLATLEHRANIRTLPVRPGARRISLSGVFAALLSVLGVLGLLAAIFRK